MTTAQDRAKFATYLRDSASGLDYAQQRYYARTMARFTSPDPYLGSAQPASPLTWNRYAYALNDPANFNDPSGMVAACPPGTRSTGWTCIPNHWTSDWTPLYDDDQRPRWFDDAVWESRSPRKVPDFVFTNVSDADDVIRQTISMLSSRLAYPAGADCAKWLETGLAKSDYGDEFPSLGALLDVLPNVVGRAKITGSLGAITAAMVTGEVPGKLIIFNTEQGFYKSTATFVAGERYAAFTGAILPNTPAGRLFLLIHEPGHLLSAEGFRPDTGNNNQPNQKWNNDLVWEHCGRLLMGGPKLLDRRR